MSASEDRRRIARVRLARVIAAGVIAVGVMVLLGWMFDIATLKSVLPVWISMKPNTALCFALAGTSLLLRVSHPERRLSQDVALVLALVVLAVGTLTLAEYLFGVDLRLDELLFRDPPGAVETVFPGRMAISTALGLVLTGFALAVFATRRYLLTQIPVLLAGSLSLLGIAGYLYSVERIGRIGPTPIAAHTAITLVALSAGLLFAQAGHGLMEYTTSDGADGVMLRQLIPAAIAVPYAGGALIAAGYRAGLYDQAFALSLFALGTVLVLVLVTAWNSRHLRRMDRASHAAFESLRASEARLQNAVEDLQAFNYSISHVLRAPLRAIHGFSTVLAREYRSSLDNEGVRLLGIVCENAEQMGRYLDDIMAFSRSANARLATQAVDVSEIVRSVWAERAPARAGREVRMQIGQLPIALADKAMTRELVAILLDNALKFTSGAQEPSVDVVGHVDNGMAVYAVRDNGAGFDMRHSSLLFGPFQRLHSEDEFPGTGMGLAIARRIVERQGGWIEGEGVVGEGATFRFGLPLPASTGEAEMPARAPDA